MAYNAYRDRRSSLTLEVTKPKSGSKTPPVYLKIEGKNVMVAGIRPGGTTRGDDTPLEEVVFDSKSLAFTYPKEKASGPLPGLQKLAYSGGWKIQP